MPERKPTVCGIQTPPPLPQRSALQRILALPGWLVIWTVKILYQKMIGPCLPKVCIYEPSCSNYMIESIQTHGLGKGVLLGCWRLLRCHPLAKGGYDPVPEKHRWKHNITVPCPDAAGGTVLSEQDDSHAGAFPDNGTKTKDTQL